MVGSYYIQTFYVLIGTFLYIFTWCMCFHLYAYNFITCVFVHIVIHFISSAFWGIGHEFINYHSHIFYARVCFNKDVWIYECVKHIWTFSSSYFFLPTETPHGLHHELPSCEAWHISEHIFSIWLENFFFHFFIIKRCGKQVIFFR